MMIDTLIETTPYVQDEPDSTTSREVAYALPSPTDTPYRTPSSSRSRQTSRTYEDMSPATTPPPLPSGDRSDKRGSNESMNASFDESLPLSDPRRFTPTLHAALVSEILNLRGDAESRMRDIERLEQHLHDSQMQNQTLNSNLLSAKSECRQYKRQMQMLEGGTLSAINELAKERDDAVKDATELRSSIEKLQKKASAHEDNAYRVQEQWQNEKEAWSAERRTLETKVHIVEGRLKVVLNEVAKAQLMHEPGDVHSPRRSQSRTSILGSPRKRPDSYGARRQSTNSNTSDQIGGRTSVLSFVNGEAINLADELDALEDIEEVYSSELEDDGRISPDALPEEATRPASRVSLKARKILGLPIDLSDFEKGDRFSTSDPLKGFMNVDSPLRKAQHQYVYVDSGVQYSPAPSPTVQRHRSLETPVSRNRESVDTARASKRLSMLSQDSAQYSVDTADNAWEENLRNLPIMVSSACQTIEQLPPPPAQSIAEAALATIDESIETREIAVQTDSPNRNSARIHLAAHSRTDSEQTVTTDLRIPTIAIIPPTSRPVTPEETAVKLPPRTKNAACQVEIHLVCEYNSKGMQTEDIRIDKRNMLPPHPNMPPPPIPTNAPPTSSFNKGKGQALSRRGNAANSSIRRTTPQPLPPINDDGPVSPGKQAIGRPVRSSSMFAGFDETEEVDEFDDDVFHDDDFFNRPMTKLMLSRGKMINQTKDLDDIEESEAAVAAGKRFALEQIRRSEENERDFEVDGDSQIKPFPRQSSKQVKRVSSSRSNSMRRTALISSGTAAHQAKSSLSSLGSGDSARPPVSIPVRYSSARVGKSISDGGRTSRGSSNASPTRNVRRVMKPSLRKTRSGPAISPAAQARARTRSQSPPLDSRVSIVPEMPNFRMPKEHQAPIISTRFDGTYGASAPRPSIAQGPVRPSSHRKENSDAFAVEQTSVVDAIAQSMVGEWMFKYVRRRKSFGKPEKDWDPTKTVEEMAASASSGVRHKRWVWLAPYEKSVMWSSKQPTDGNSLLGKSGRKLTIKSVLDVKDDNPMPKGSVIGPHFNRSILILTPQRALKFTATTQERHYIWLTALSFLSHSPISMNDLTPLPPMPPEEPASAHDISPAASLGGSMRRRPIRDSIRIAKGSSARPQFRSFTTDGIPTTSGHARPPSREQYDPINDAAMPPVIRRYHNRNRSNTAPKPTASAFRALLSRDSGPSTTAPSVAVTSEKTPTDRGQPTPSLHVPSMPSSRRGSEASALGRPPLGPPISGLDAVGPHFFDSTANSGHAANMTMRMDAFMADQQRNAMMGNRGPPGPGPARGGLRNLRLGRPSMRNLKDPSTSSWVQQENNANIRDSMSPVETLPTPTELRFSESTTRGSSEVGAGGGYFRGF
ncbi:hypothetical protein PMZ80_007199 [Knufia obscura]|uniref:Pleckstrin homology domain-containing protein n=2 Tax=Knufia TaxID=430999 RepID=A0AAN8I5M4_9EURO|nr:hypothetical protein PMZ80_007199 [Knufia obscura]KAK5953209.1 hypothetical protein OHC33_005777 [Knufia fluminis]